MSYLQAATIRKIQNAFPQPYEKFGIGETRRRLESNRLTWEQYLAALRLGVLQEKTMDDQRVVWRGIFPEA